MVHIVIDVLICWNLSSEAHCSCMPWKQQKINWIKKIVTIMFAAEIVWYVINEFKIAFKIAQNTL